MVFIAHDLYTGHGLARYKGNMTNQSAAIVQQWTILRAWRWGIGPVRSENKYPYFSLFPVYIRVKTHYCIELELLAALYVYFL